MANEAQPVIRRLDEDVINRIAAGEVIQRPANAIKEMLENCLDAGASSITVTIKGGGLKMLQISDNGHGIRKEDMDIVCERFTTSKLREFGDLRSISTFGFRGEALASVSHVSHLTICTRTKDSKCAYKASYLDGKLKEQPRPTAGNVGTQITAEDLFYNVPTRRKALTNASEEHQRIADVVSKYSIHNSGVAFTLRKAGQGAGDISVRTQQTATIIDNIGVIFGSHISKELLHVEHNDDGLKYKMSGYVTNANCSIKKFIFLLFINHRLVDCTALKRSLDSVYQAYLPKGSHPFVYLSLEIAPHNIDVNVHPTKHEVHFLNEEEIIESVQTAVELKLRGCNTSRTFYTQTLLPTISGATAEDVVKRSKPTNDQQAKVYDHQMVRTDSKLQKLDAFLQNTSTSKPEVEILAQNPSKIPKMDLEEESDKTGKTKAKVMEMQVPVASKLPGSIKPSSGQEQNLTTTSFKKRRQIRLSSVLKLQQEIKDNAQSELEKVIRDHTWVGCIDPELALIQYETKLFMANTTLLSEELFYQIMVFDFGNFGIFRLSEPAPTFKLVMLALNDEEAGWRPADGNKTSLANRVIEFVKEKSDLLADYFSLETDKDGNITGVPMLLPDYVPAMEGLPMFILRLTTEVDWESEIDCFRTICRECARFYSVRKGFIDLAELIQQSNLKTMEKNETDDPELDAQEGISATPTATQTACGTSWRWTTEHVIYRAFQKILLPTKAMLDDGTFLQLASLPDLYKVFERC